MTLEEHVQWFGQEMLRKLNMNVHKCNEEGWRDMNHLDLFMALRGEVIELGEELLKQDYSNIIKEASDVANFAMMIADKANLAIHMIDAEKRRRQSNDTGSSTDSDCGSV